MTGLSIRWQVMARLLVVISFIVTGLPPASFVQAADSAESVTQSVGESTPSVIQSVNKPVPSEAPPTPQELPINQPAQAIIPDPIDLPAHFLSTPLTFIPNHGQFDEDIAYEAQVGRTQLRFRTDSVELQVSRATLDQQSIEALHNLQNAPQHLRAQTQVEKSPYHLEIKYHNTNNQTILLGESELLGLQTYSFPDEGREYPDIPTYGALRYTNIYSGIDILFEDTDGLIKSTYNIAPKSDPSQIRWTYQGAKAVSHTTEGDLEIILEADGETTTLIEQAPTAWQEQNGTHVPVDVAFNLDPINQEVSFQIGSYDVSLPLVIDPTIEFDDVVSSTESNNNLVFTATAVGPDGSIYVAGQSSPSTLVGSVYYTLFRKYSSNGVLLRNVPIYTSQYLGIDDMVIGSDGYLYVIGTKDLAFRSLYYAKLNSSTFARILEDDTISDLSGIAIDVKDGIVYTVVNNTLSNRYGIITHSTSTTPGTPINVSTGIELRDITATDNGVFVIGHTSNTVYLALVNSSGSVVSSGSFTLNHSASSIAYDPNTNKIIVAGVGSTCCFASVFTYGSTFVHEGSVYGLGSFANDAYVAVDGASIAYIVDAGITRLFTLDLTQSSYSLTLATSELVSSYVSIRNIAATDATISLVGHKSGSTLQGLLVVLNGDGSTTLNNAQTRNPEDCVCHNPPAQISTADPVNTRSGNFSTQITDLSVLTPGAPIVWTRSYASQATETIADGGLGYGWQHPFGRHLLLDTDVITVVSGVGNELRFTETLTDVFEPAPGIYSTLIRGTTTYTQTSRNQSQYIYNSAGQLIQIIDPQQNSLDLFYSGSPSRLTRIEDAADSNRYLTLTYSGDRIAQVSDGVRTISYGYDGAGDLVSFADVMGRATTYSYTNHLLTTITNAAGQLVESMTYDAYTSDGKVIAQTLQDGRANAFSYLQATTIMTTTGQDGRQKVTYYDYGSNNALRQVRTSTRNEEIGDQPAPQSTLGSAFDSSFSPAAVVDGNGNTTQTSYTEQGLPLERTDALGNTARAIYDDQNRPISTTNTLGLTSLYLYDSYGNLISTTTGITTTSPIRYTSLYTYTTPTVRHPSGLIEAQSGPDGLVTHYSYTPAGQIASVTAAYGTPDAQTTSYGYDALGRVITTTVGVGTAFERSNVTHYNFDNTVAATIQNYQDGIFDPNNPTEDLITTYGYDVLGRSVAVTDTLGFVSATHYNAAGRVDWSVRNLSPVQFDSLGLPVFQAFSASTPDANVATLYGYDGLGRTFLVTETGLLTGTFNLATKRFSSTTQRVTLTEYDELSRPMTVTLNYQPSMPFDTLPDVNLRTLTRYDGAGNVIATRDAFGRWTKTDYDALNRPITVTVNYDDGDPLTGPAGADLISVSQYDSEGRLLASIENYVDGIFTVTEPITDRITFYEYDAQGRVITTTRNYDPATVGTRTDTNLTSVTDYDPITGRVVGSQNALGIWMSNVYDARGRLEGTVLNCTIAGVPASHGCDPFDGDYPDRNIQGQTRYDAVGRAYEQVDPLGVVTHTDFDILGRSYQTIRNYDDGVFSPDFPDQDVITQEAYDALGRTVVMTDALGVSTTQAYNGLGQLISSTDAMERTSEQGYDGQGNLRWSAAPDGSVTVYLLDGLSRVRTTITNYEDGVVAPNEPPDQDLMSHTEYDRAGRQAAVENAAGFVTSFAYNLSNQLIGVIENAQDGVCSLDPCNVATTYTYDRAGNRTAVTDPRGSTVYSSYDAANNHVSLYDALFQLTQWEYDQLGRVTRKRDPRGSDFDVHYEYDGLDRMVEMFSLELDAPIQLDYDEAGRRTALHDSTGITSFHYDALGQITEVAAPVTGSVGYGYNARGERTQLIYPDLSVMTYTYWDDGQLQSVIHNENTLASYNYDIAGRLEEVISGNGAETTYTYDAAGRTQSMLTTVGEEVVSGFGYTLDRQGLRTEVEELLPVPAPEELPPGVGLLGWYFGDTTFSDLRMRRVDPAINFRWHYNAPDPRLEPDDFSIRWEGELLPPVTGIYTFEVKADDRERLIIDGQTIIDDWDEPTGDTQLATIALTANVAVPFTLLYREDWDGASIRLRWQRPDRTRLEIIPSEVFSHTLPAPDAGGSGDGLQGLYYPNSDLSDLPVLSVIDPQIAFDWRYGSPSGTLPIDEFSVEWRGQVTPRYTGVYTFTAEADDGVRLKVDGQELFNDLDDPQYGRRSGTIALVADTDYDIEVDFTETGGDAHIHLWWSSPDQVRELIPQSRLFSSQGRPIRIEPTITPTWATSGLLGSYYDDLEAGDLRMRRVDEQIEFAWSDDSPSDQLDDAFTVHWRGELIPPETGLYTFITHADDRERLIINNQVVIDDWDDVSLEPEIGTIFLTEDVAVPMEIQYRDDHGAAAITLSWIVPGEIDDEVVPDSVLVPATVPTPVPNDGYGLLGYYYDNDSFSDNPVLVRIDSRLEFDWFNGSPSSAIRPESFSVEWIGSVHPRYTGVYTFTAQADSGVGVRVGSTDLFDDLSMPEAGLHRGSIHLTAGQAYPVLIRYRHVQYDGPFRVWWSSEDQIREIVPPDHLELPESIYVPITPSATATHTMTPSVTPSGEPTFLFDDPSYQSEEIAPTMTRTASVSRTATVAGTATPTSTRTQTRTATVTRTASPTRTATVTKTPSVTRTSDIPNTHEQPSGMIRVAEQVLGDAGPLRVFLPDVRQSASQHRNDYGLSPDSRNPVLANQILSSHSRTITYSYDGLQRLIAAEELPGNSYTYGYDLAGNRISHTTNGVTTTLSYNAGNQVVGWSYDAAGNLLSDGQNTFSYDALNRVRNQDDITNIYNGDGVLVQRDGTFYTQDLAAPLTQVLNDGATNYAYGHQRLASAAGDWYLTDALGSLRVTLDGSGDLLNGYYYDPFGTPQRGLDTPFGFTGELQQQDGTSYLRARWYSSANGSFTSRDPFAGFDNRPYSLHPYQYGYSNPALYSDPSGEYACTDNGNKYKEFCEEQRELLKNDVTFNSMRTYNSAGTYNMLRALVYMFGLETLPGGKAARAQGYKAPRHTPAAERLEFVLWITETSDGYLNYTHFNEFSIPLGVDPRTQTDSQCGDIGFAENLRDCDLWSKSSNQVGHFLTAVDIAYRFPTRADGIRCVVGHERSSDGGNTLHTISQCLDASLEDIYSFATAVQAEQNCNYDLRDRYIAKMLPELSENFDPDDFQGRYGNSRQDLRLSVKGWLLGDLIYTNQLTEVGDVANWIDWKLR